MNPRFWPGKQALPDNTEFRIIGPRSSGKTAYLAALAYWPRANPNSPIASVTPMDDDTKKFISIAKDVLETGAQMAATSLPDNPEVIPSYGLKITMKSDFKFSNQSFEVICKDFAGELFKKLRNQNTAEIELYLDEYAEVPGLLILLDGTFFTQDTRYAEGLASLQSELNLRLVAKNKPLNNYRIAVVFSKAEQPQIWTHRRNLKRFMGLKFPKTYQVLQQWSLQWKSPINYFFCSAFGMKGNPPTPNVEVTNRENGVTLGIIARKEAWRPFGLVAPIYWLYTGEDIPELRDIEV